MNWLINFIKKLFKIESKQEYAYKLTLSFIKQFGLTTNDKENIEFFYVIFLEWGKTKNGMKNLYELLSEAYVVFAKLLKAEPNSLKSLDPDVSEAQKNKKSIIKLLEFVLSKAKTKGNFEKILEAIDRQEVIDNVIPSVVIRFLIPVMLDNLTKLNVKNDLVKFANIIAFYRNVVNQEILIFLENIFGIYLDIYIKYKNDIEVFAMSTIQDFNSFIDIYKDGDKETIRTFIKYVASSYLLFHINNYKEYSEEVKQYFDVLLQNLKQRYEQDEALLQAVFITLYNILKLSSSLNDVTLYVQSVDNYIVDFIEVAKSEQVKERLKENKMFFYASKKIKKDIYTTESLLINYVAYAIPNLLNVCQNIDLFEYCRTLVKDLMNTFIEVEIAFYYIYVVLPRWVKANKNQDILFDMHEKLKRILYPMQKDMSELVRFFYFDFKDYMV
ncbi:hypothetical protein HY04AAS1_1098 [Hydrogenobaculum sp. Y04AAS1]|uniref:hypothetical protein n=1 Tax=Hydrogenobaculum sp. (strain Y04AAS1) TaxID=380749 RepID=UPI00017BBD77|nr:hypothetical protein HY04AAS1_1098 [Hydrogenobaculum sp. Y04AAS1]HCT66349.1 hypothetical protein [Hydrogenobaculum sp.]